MNDEQVRPVSYDIVQAQQAYMLFYGRPGSSHANQGPAKPSQVQPGQPGPSRSSQVHPGPSMSNQVQAGPSRSSQVLLGPAMDPAGSSKARPILANSRQLQSVSGRSTLAQPITVATPARLVNRAATIATRQPLPSSSPKLMARPSRLSVPTLAPSVQALKAPVHKPPPHLQARPSVLPPLQPTTKRQQQPTPLNVRNVVTKSHSDMPASPATCQPMPMSPTAPSLQQPTSSAGRRLCSFKRLHLRGSTLVDVSLIMYILQGGFRTRYLCHALRRQQQLVEAAVQLHQC